MFGGDCKTNACKTRFTYRLRNLKVRVELRIDETIGVRNEK